MQAMQGPIYDSQEKRTTSENRKCSNFVLHALRLLRVFHAFYNILCKQFSLHCIAYLACVRVETGLKSQHIAVHIRYLPEKCSKLPC